MTGAAAALICLIGRYLRGLMDPFVTLLEVHKPMYFMQEAGQPLRLRYVRAPYGPYASSCNSGLLYSATSRFPKLFETAFVEMPPSEHAEIKSQTLTAIKLGIDRENLATFSVGPACPSFSIHGHFRIVVCPST